MVVTYIENRAILSVINKLPSAIGTGCNCGLKLSPENPSIEINRRALDLRCWKSVRNGHDPRTLGSLETAI